MTHKSNSRHREEESAAVVWVVRASGASQKTKRAVLLGLKGTGKNDCFFFCGSSAALVSLSGVRILFY
jgi:hypothetical protein